MGAATDLYHELAAHGLTLAAEAGNLLVAPRDLLNDDLRVCIRAAKPDLLALLAGNIAMEPAPAPAPVPEPEPAPEPALVATHRAWLVTLADGGYLEITSTPPSPLEEIRQRHPDAIAIEPYDPPDARHEGRVNVAPVSPTAMDTTTEVSCSTCHHWRPDRINPMGGLGRCLVKSPASRRPGSLWPSGTILCQEHEPAGGES